jgi:hypothetical protein
MKQILRRLFFYFQKVYRITISYKKYEEIVWSDLKKLHNDANWRYGVFESDKRIEAVFEIGDKIGTTYYYMVYDGQYHCRVKVIENFDPELTTELFILAAHFNNLLNNGVVAVNVQSGFVEYHTKSEYIVNIIYPGELHAQLLNHFNISKDIFWAFNKLVHENEEPTLIIADLMKKNNSGDAKSNGDHSSE